jgi:integrase
MVETKLLTQPGVDKLKPGATLRWIKDAGAQSLYLTIAPRQAGDKRNPKSWMLRARGPNRRPAKIVLGPYDRAGVELDGIPEIGQPLGVAAARALAADLLRRLKRGEDIFAEHRARRARQRTEVADKEANAFGACVVEFIRDYRTKKHQTRPRRWHEDARVLGLNWPRDCDPADIEPEIIRNGLAESWANKSVTEIDEAAIYAVVDDARKRGIPGLDSRNGGVSEARGRRMHAALSVLFRWLRRKRLVTHNPCRDLDRPGPPPAREHYLNASELRWLWWACADEPIFGPAVRLMVLTGQRLNEIAGLRRSELYDDGAVWTIPGTRTKNHKRHTVHLAPLACKQIAGLDGTSDLMFTTNNTTSLSGWSRFKGRLDRKMLELARRELEAKAVIRDWRFHDLRRGFATGCGELGIPGEVIKLALNHSSGARRSVAGTYNRSERMEERKIAFERWAQHVKGIVERRPANVTQLRKPAS